MAKVYNFAYYGGIKMNEVTIFDVANYFLAHENMTHKKLQKLCYYAQAWYLAFNSKRLFYGNFEAWVHGPVNPDLYSEFKSYGYEPISLDIDIPNKFDNDTLEFLDSVYETYKAFSGDQLETLTHLEDPWRSARKNLEEWEPSHNVISEKIMAEFYLRVYENQPEAQA